MIILSYIQLSFCIHCYPLQFFLIPFSVFFPKYSCHSILINQHIVITSLHYIPVGTPLLQVLLSTIWIALTSLYSSVSSSPAIYSVSIAAIFKLFPLT